MKRAKGVQLINVFDYPRNYYTAFWEIAQPMPSPDPMTPGFVARARIISYEPLRWLHNGVETKERPNVPLPVYPADLPVGLLPNVQIISSQACMKVWEELGRPPNVTIVAELAEARNKKCQQIHAAGPQPIHVLEEMVDTADTEEEARTITQKWVLERIGNYRRPTPAMTYSDDDINHMVEIFDAAREQKNFGKVDQIRGLLKATGVKLYTPDGTSESESPIGYEGKTTWSRS